uniref:TORC_N domain-containing protein n=1 Tax=Caenorhabditis japonica TaxID=281687 RepID=A0A8R1HY17_CAEJA
MSNSNTPRKFSEKIAILERKQNEENTTFEDIMRQVQSITHQPGDSSESSSTTAPIAIPHQGTSGGLHPPSWGHNLGGSLPNVHQMPSYSPPQWPPNWHQDVMHRPMQGHRSRSPEDHMIGSASGSPSHHYHPYGVRANGRSPDRVPTQHPHYPPYGPPYNQPGGLVPPDSWNQINRARSDPAIHNMGGMVPMHPIHQMPIHHMPHFIQNAMPGPSGMSPQVTPQGSQQGSPLQQHHQIPAPLQMGGTSTSMTNGMSPLQSPNHMMTPMYGFHNGSPLHSPMDSPHASTLMLDGSGTPCMELSPPGMHDFNADSGSLSNLHNHPQMQLMQQQQQQQQQQQSPQTSDYQTNGCNGMNGGGGYYHAPVGPRHSTGACGPRLVPGPALTSESQSAPTSPHNQLDPNQPPMWPTRTFSNSPEALDIPKLTITNAEGAPGHHVDCFNDLDDLNLDSLDNVHCNGGSAPQCFPPNSFHDPGGPQQMLQN